MAESEKTAEDVKTSSEVKAKVDIKEQKDSSGEPDEKIPPEDKNKIKGENEDEKLKINEDEKPKTNKVEKNENENQKEKQNVIKFEKQTVENFVEELLKEKETIDVVKCPKIRKLIDDKIYDIKHRGKNLNINNMMNGITRVVERVYIPSVGKRKPHFLIPKLIGIKGQNLRRMERDTNTRITIKGKGSKIDKKSETETKNLMDPKYDHLSEEPHLEIVSEALPEEAHLSISNAIKHLKSFISNEENISNSRNNPSVWNNMQDTVQIILPQRPSFEHLPNFSQQIPSFLSQQHFGMPSTTSMVMQTPSQNYIIPGVNNGGGNHFGRGTSTANGSSPAVFRNNIRSRPSPYNRPAPVRRVIEIDSKK